MERLCPAGRWYRVLVGHSGSQSQCHMFRSGPQTRFRPASRPMSKSSSTVGFHKRSRDRFPLTMWQLLFDVWRWGRSHLVLDGCIRLICYLDELIRCTLKKEWGRAGRVGAEVNWDGARLVFSELTDLLHFSCISSSLHLAHLDNKNGSFSLHYFMIFECN